MTNVKEPLVLGFMGPPGTGKTVAMEIVEHEANRKAVGDTLGLGRLLNVGVARKSTSRPSRGADDRLKESGVDEAEFDKPEMIGVYTLSNNGAKYAYRESALRAEGVDVLIAEPSLHHIEAVKLHLGGRLFTIFLAASREYRLARLSGRGTEDPVEVRKRVLEGDAQIIIASMLGAEMSQGADVLTDSLMVEIFTKIQDSDDDLAVGQLSQYLADYAGGDAEAAKKYGDTTAKLFAHDIRHVHGGQKAIEHVITLDDSYLSKDPKNEGKYREEILAQLARGLKSA